MAIFSECLEDTEDMLWDIWTKEGITHELHTSKIPHSPETFKLKRPHLSNIYIQE